MHTSAQLFSKWAAFSSGPKVLLEVGWAYHRSNGDLTVFPHWSIEAWSFPKCGENLKLTNRLQKVSFWEDIVLDGYVSFGGVVPTSALTDLWKLSLLEITLPLVKEPPFLPFHGATRSLEVPEFSSGPSCLGSQGFLTFGNQAKQLLPTKNMARDRNSETNSPKHLPESHSQEANEKVVQS